MHPHPETCARLLLAIALVFVSGCDDAEPATGGDTDRADATQRPDTPSPWIYPEADTESGPTLPAATLSEAVSTVVDLAIELDVDPIIALHELIYPPPTIGEGDLSGCPAFLTYDYGDATAYYWQGECTAANGTSFSGLGYIAIYDDFTDEFGTFTGKTVTMSGRITAPDGTFLEGSGNASAIASGNAEFSADTRILDGSWLAGGPRAPSSPDDAWLDGSRRPNLGVLRWTFLATGGKNLTVSGGLSFASDSPLPTGVTAVALEAFTARAELAGATCEREPGGVASIRDEAGTWYDVLFDGPTDEAPETPPDLCDGCGQTWHRALAVDPTCVDARELLRGLQ